MEIQRVLVTAAATALLSTASLALAPAASAHGRPHHHGHHHAAAAAPSVAAAPTTRVPPAPLPDGSAVQLRPAQDHVTTTTSTSSAGRASSSAALDFVIPACTGTVDAYFQLNQDGVYVKVKGATAYPCAATDQTVTVTYSPADPGQGSLHPGPVVLRTETWGTDPVTGSTVVLESATTTLLAVSATV